MNNPLLEHSELPLFSHILPEHIVSAVTQSLNNCRNVIEKVVNQADYRWDSLIQPIDEADELFNRVWSPVSHLNSVKNIPEWRAAYEECLPLISEYSTWAGQHQGLYDAYKKLKNSDEFSRLSKPQKKVITNALLDFELSGINLPKAQQKRYGELAAHLSELSSTFSNNVLDATMGWSKLVDDVVILNGLPESILSAMAEKAHAKDQNGWLLTLDIPSYLPVMTYCNNSELRYELYHAYVTRASEQGPNAGKWDNSAVMMAILNDRLELANLLGFKAYSDKSLAKKMANDPNQVIDFLNELAKKAKPQAEQELSQLKQFAKNKFNVDELNPWDIAYYSEKQKQALYTINDEELRPYFPESTVLNGLFEVTHRLFDVTIKQRENVDVWNADVKFYDLFDKNGQLQASFYLDLYAREHKRGGAWMDDCKGKMRFSDGHTQHPVAYLTCNFNRPIGDKPALFTHNEVTTLFHEFGHGLHHMLTDIDCASVSGINGVAWDAVELPSQLLENWCWEPEALKFISGHYLTGEPLPNDLLDKMMQAKNYQAGLFILRQLEFGLFDLTLHSSTDAENQSLVLDTLNAVRQEVAVVPTVNWGRFPHAFSHVFAGGYAAGYYSYLWAEVLSSDAFARFKEEGIFNSTTGHDFLTAFLSKGGSDDAMTLFKAFRGREPELEPLLVSYGIVPNSDSVN